MVPWMRLRIHLSLLHPMQNLIQMQMWEGQPRRTTHTWLKITATYSQLKVVSDGRGNEQYSGSCCINLSALHEVASDLAVLQLHSQLPKFCQAAKQHLAFHVPKLQALQIRHGKCWTYKLHTVSESILQHALVHAPDARAPTRDMANTFALCQLSGSCLQCEVIYKARCSAADLKDMSPASSQGTMVPTAAGESLHKVHSWVYLTQWEVLSLHDAQAQVLLHMDLRSALCLLYDGEYSMTVQCYLMSETFTRPARRVWWHDITSK